MRLGTDCSCKKLIFACSQNGITAIYVPLSNIDAVLVMTKLYKNSICLVASLGMELV